MWRVDRGRGGGARCVWVVGARLRDRWRPGGLLLLVWLWWVKKDGWMDGEVEWRRSWWRRLWLVHRWREFQRVEVEAALWQLRLLPLL